MTSGPDAPDDLPEIDRDELHRRIVYSLFRPVSRLASVFGLSLKELTSLLEIACYHQLKRASLTLEEAADALGVSRRKVAQLSKKLKKNFFDPEREHGLPRRIEYMLWAGEMTEGRIRQAIPDEDDEAITEALDQLVRQERVVVEDEGYTKTYSVPDSEFRLYENNWLARIDGLNNLLRNLTDAVIGRFFENDASAFARTLNFRMRRSDIDQLRELYESEIYPTLRDLEETADGDPEAEVVDMSLSALWAPQRDEFDPENEDL